MIKNSKPVQNVENEEINKNKVGEFYPKLYS